MLFNNIKKNFSKNALKLLIIHVLFALAAGLSNLFLNIYIWKFANSLGVVVKYNIFCYISLPLIFLFGGWISKKRGLRINLILGLIIYSLFYSLVLILKESIINYIIYLGLLRGVALGFYHTTFNVLSYDLSSDKNRDFFYGIFGFIESITSMIAPFIAGLLISTFSNTTGYTIIFTTSLILFILSSILSFFIHDNAKRTTYVIDKIAVVSLKTYNWKSIMISESIKGMRESIMPIFINIFLFIIVRNEFVIGNYTFITSLFTTIACYLASILIHPKSRLKYIFVGSILMSIISSIFIFNMDIIVFWTFGILNSIISIFVRIPQNSISFNVISSIKNSKDKRIESIIIKEIFLNIGRIVSLLLLILVSYSNELMTIIVAFVGVIQFGIWILFRNIDTSKLKRKLINSNHINSNDFIKSGSLFHLSNNFTVPNVENKTN